MLLKHKMTLISIILSLLLTGCGNSATPAAETNTVDEVSTETAQEETEKASYVTEGGVRYRMEDDTGDEDPTLAALRTRRKRQQERHLPQTSRQSQTEKEETREEKPYYVIGDPQVIDVVSDGIMSPGEALSGQVVFRYTDKMLEEQGLLTEDMKDAKICHYNKMLEGYEPLESTLDTEGMKVTASPTLPGEYVLAIDRTAPEVKSLNVSLDDLFYVVNAEMNDFSAITDLDLKIDDYMLADSTNYMIFLIGHKLCYQIPAINVSKTPHTISLIAEDAAGDRMEEPYSYDLTPGEE